MSKQEEDSKPTCDYLLLDAWGRYEDKCGNRFWRQPDDKPPTEGKIVEDADFSMNPLTRYRPDPPLDLYGNRFDELVVGWSYLQCCTFLAANGIDSEGNPLELRLSVNLGPRRSAAPGYFCCRDDAAAYEAPLIDEMRKRKLLEPTGIHAESGFRDIPLFRFTPFEQP
jgi:hypothetical protein